MRDILLFSPFIVPFYCALLFSPFLCPFIVSFFLSFYCLLFCVCFLLSFFASFYCALFCLFFSNGAHFFQKSCLQKARKTAFWSLLFFLKEKEETPKSDFSRFMSPLMLCRSYVALMSLLCRSYVALMDEF